MLSGTLGTSFTMYSQVQTFDGSNKNITACVPYNLNDMLYIVLDKVLYKIKDSGSGNFVLYYCTMTLLLRNIKYQPSTNLTVTYMSIYTYLVDINCACIQFAECVATFTDFAGGRLNIQF